MLIFEPKSLMYLYINILNTQALNFGAKVEFILRLLNVYC